jgi:hypothetical protein
VWTTEDQTVAASHSVAPARWQAGLEELLGRVAGRFGRVEPRRRARAFVLGLLAELPRKNCWTIAEHAGDASPDGMQHLLARSAWDHDGVRDDVRDYLVEHLGEDAAVLVIDETGDLKKGTATVGVQRQYTGTAGRIENAQVAVWLVYASSAGHGLVDRELYVPQGWIDDPERCQAAGIPGQVGFATKPALAARMLGRALDAGVPAGWVAGDEGYGADPGAASRAGGPRGRLRAGGRLRPPGPGRRDGLPRRRPAQQGPGAGVAAGVVRPRRQGPPVVRLGVLPPRRRRPCWWRAGRPALAAGPPPPAHRRAGLLPLGHPGHARPRFPGGRRRHRPGPRSRAVRPDQADLQRGPAPVRRPRRRPRR